MARKMYCVMDLWLYFICMVHIDMFLYVWRMYEASKYKNK